MSQAEVSQTLLDEIVCRIVDVADPEKIILFGSQARGDAGPNSDIDLLVIEKEVDDVYEEGYRVRAALRGIDSAIDVMVRSLAYFNQYRDTLGCVIADAAAEGRTLYEQK